MTRVSAPEALARPRFEFRSFGQNFDRIHHRMSRFSVPVPEEVWERRSSEVYILSSANDLINTKIRDGMIDIKSLLRTVDGLEQWTPVMKRSFPVHGAAVRNEVFPALRLPAPDRIDDICSQEAFLGMVAAHQQLQSVRVSKRRFGYLVHDGICEYAEVLINGARVVTVASESADLASLRRIMTDLQMTGMENINYVQAIKRVIGLSSLALANE